MPKQSVVLEGKPYVLVPKEEFERIELKAEAAELPPLPERAADGTVPAIEFARVSMARDIILARVELGLTQPELAQRAGIRIETLRRVESGKHTLSVATIDKIDRALKRAAKAQRRRRRSS
jgi:DNA-binding XRE family transcriptional regulator